MRTEILDTESNPCSPPARGRRRAISTGRTQRGGPTVGNLALRNGGLSDSRASGLPAMSEGAKRGSILRRGFPVLNQKLCSLEGLNHLAWAGRASITAFGLRVGVRVTSPEFLDRFLGCIPVRWKCARPQGVDRLYSFIARGASPGVDLRGSHLLYANDQRLA